MNGVSAADGALSCLGAAASLERGVEAFCASRLGGGRNAFEYLLAALGITQKNGQPNHPQTQGKVERFQQTMKNWLRAQPGQPATLAELQVLLDAFAVTGDVLTFYQERIANEGYLGTATQDRSVRELARLIGYEPSPGVSAGTYLAFTLDSDPETPVTIAAGTGAQ